MSGYRATPGRLGTQRHVFGWSCTCGRERWSWGTQDAAERAARFHEMTHDNPCLEAEVLGDADGNPVVCCPAHPDLVTPPGLEWADAQRRRDKHVEDSQNPPMQWVDGLASALLASLEDSPAAPSTFAAIVTEEGQ